MVRVKDLRKFCPFFLFLILLLSPESAQTSPPNFEISSHQLGIQIDPPQHLIKAEDRLKIQIKDKKAQNISLLLHPSLRITRIVNLKTGKPLRWFEASFSPHAKRLDIPLKREEKSLSLSISYEGRIYDPIVKEGELQFVRGDRTSGLIGQEGVYLSSSSHWYPDKPGSMASFEVEAAISEPFRVVTQGELLSQQLKDGLWKSKWSYELPTEGLTLVAGKYSVKSRDADGAKISTYFFPEDERYSEIFLTAAEEYLKIYSNLLGQYPYKKFDIVQNFFSSGYSFPTFTLLAPEAIRQGKEFLRPGALDHEIVHSWWGHYVSGKPGTGNWVEALTTYCTNYYYKELKIGEEAARKHRQDVMQKYAVQVPSSKDYPLRQFEDKEGELDAQIGYGKGSMVFHMLRQIVGKGTFFSTLRGFAKRYGGKQAGWENIHKIFEEESGKRLDGFFSQWLDRPGGPQLKLENVSFREAAKGYFISGEVVQEGEVYQLLLPIEVDEGLQKKSFLLDVSKRRNHFSAEVPKIPLRLSLDPEAHLFRKLYPEEVTPGLNVLLEDREKILVLSDHEEKESRKVYTELARMTQEKKGGEILSVREMTEEKILNSSLMLLGESWKNPAFTKLISNLPSPIRVRDGEFFVDGNRVNEEEESLLLTTPHPLRPGKWVTIYFGISATALSRARYIFFYGWDSYILFRRGRPAARGSFPPLSSFTSYNFFPKEDLDKIQPERLRDYISYLASPELGGRLPGTSGYHKAQTYLVKQLGAMGMMPIFQPFSISVKDVGAVDLRLMTLANEEEHRAIPLIFSKEGEWKGPCLSFDERESDKVQDLEGKAVVYHLKFSEDKPEEMLFDKIRKFQSSRASAILFFIKEEDLDHISPYITYPSYFPPKLEERLKKREQEGLYILRSMEASKVVAGGKPLSLSIEIPVVFIPYSQAEETWTKDLLAQRNISIELSVRFKEMKIRDLNIGGIISGNDPEKKDEFLVLGAHYDHLGKDEKGGVYYPGADDNASGVAAVLEIGRSVMKRRGDLRRSLMILFFGGEEWGLLGSQCFVENPFVPLNQIKAMLSVDSIGGSAEEKEVFFVGSSVHPSLAQRSRRFLQWLGIKEGRDIDRYAFFLGSDHYPFHLKGIPCLDYFASDFRKQHTLRDNLETINFENLADVTRLIYLTVYEFLTEP
jgi:aminopeptidase N